MGKKHTQEFVESYFQSENCSLIDLYKDARTPMSYVCECGNLSKISFDNFKKGKRCKRCGLNKLADTFKLDYQKVYDYFKNNGCTLLSDEYKNGHSLLEYICNCGSVSKIRFFDFRKGKRCWNCKSMKNSDRCRLDYATIKQKFKDAGCVLLSKEYYNAHESLEYICSCGTKSKINYDKFRLGQRCYQCKLKKISGENHFKWNPLLTEEERSINRNYPEYRKWAEDVKRRDNFTCQVCYQIGGELVSHHLENYRDNKDVRTDVNNGITLCKICHTDFHKTYGYFNTNEEQYKEFKLNRNLLINITTP